MQVWLELVSFFYLLLDDPVQEVGIDDCFAHIVKQSTKCKSAVFKAAMCEVI